MQPKRPKPSFRGGKFFFENKTETATSAKKKKKKKKKKERKQISSSPSKLNQFDLGRIFN